MFTRQFMAIQAKNWTQNIRQKQFIWQNASIFILSIFIIVSQKTKPNSFQTPFYLGIAVTSYSRAIATWWLQEKETQQKQLQKIMGVNYLSYLLSWLVYFVMNGLIICVVALVIMRAAIITDDTVFAQGYGFIDIIPLYLLFVLSNIGFVLMFCSFFTKVKTGAQAITFVQLIINFLYFLRFSKAVAQNQAIVILLSIFPQMSFNMGIGNIAFIDTDTYDNFPKFNISYGQTVFTLAIATVFYVVIALYLEQVIPGETGTRKHPLFFLGIGRKGNSVEEDSKPIHQRLLEGEITEGKQNQSSAKYEQKVQRNENALIQIKNLYKDFGDHRVIDNLSLSFYGGQIFCLLGHNGAGKSTTINLLTGLLEATSGQIDILGLKYPRDVDEIRKQIGLCLQFNVLYDNLTVEEHLRFYYRIKRSDDERIQAEIEKTIMDCALANQRGKLSKNLSGGNKRKLCLANSLIGGSKIIFLDEPSSGLDPNSRQSIWQILRTISTPQRCIILTTHHLEQAQALSKRIAIMSKGKLIILGSTNFITNQFSVGYHAVITLNKDKAKAADIAREIVMKGLSKCVEDKQTAKHTVKFRLPMEEIRNFQKVFHELQRADIGMISVYVSNLEDAFVKIGQEEEQFTQGFEQLNASSQQQASKQLLPRQQQQASSKDVVLPNVSCSYSFTSQFTAVFFRKALTVLRSFSTVISIIMPSLFMSVGVLVVCLLIPNNETNPVDRVTLDRIRLFVMSYFMVWAFIFNTSSYCGSIVLQREKRFKYISNVSGIRQLPYWTANYVFDLTIFYLPISFFFIIVLAIGKQGQFITRFAGYLIGMLTLFGFSFIGYSYLFSFIFQKSSTAFRFFPFINLLFFYLLPSLPMAINPESFLAQYVMPFLTPFVAFANFFNTKEIVGSDQGQSYAYGSLIVSYLALAIQAVVYAIVTLVLENIRFSLKANQDEQFQNQMYQQQQFHQVPQMQQQQQGPPPPVRQSMEYAPISVSHLTKVYGNGKVAIRDNSFAVGQGQIFGLLGPNGAGKSTSFNIITAAMPKSSGSVQLFQQEVNKGIMNIFQQVGVCPQYNPIYENLTVEEHLLYFTRLKGIPKDDQEPTIKFYGTLLSLDPYMKVKAGVLSGGNKRKMCVAMAMIGNPNVAFFDEPSAGVDPISRRYLWKCLAASANTRKTSMVLTTHSMNEAESLCSRIGILINGQFVCLDTPKGLKEQYGKGYRVDVVAKVETHEQLQKMVEEQFGEVKVEKMEEIKPEHLTFVIKSDKFCLSKAFGLFENKLKEEGKISWFEVKESTLEEVFIHLSRFQPVVEEQEFKEPWQLLCWEWGTNGCQLVA